MPDLHKWRLDEIAENVHGLKDIERMGYFNDKDKTYLHNKVKQNAVKEFERQDRERNKKRSR